jgi:hypothetical protein
MGAVMAAARSANCRRGAGATKPWRGAGATKPWATQVNKIARAIDEIIVIRSIDECTIDECRATLPRNPKPAVPHSSAV